MVWWQHIWELCPRVRLCNHLQAIKAIILNWLCHFLNKKTLLFVISLDVIPVNILLFREHLVHWISHLHLSKLASLGFKSLLRLISWGRHCHHLHLEGLWLSKLALRWLSLCFVIFRFYRRSVFRVDWNTVLVLVVHFRNWAISLRRDDWRLDRCLNRLRFDLRDFIEFNFWFLINNGWWLGYLIRLLSGWFLRFFGFLNLATIPNSNKENNS